jgi:hypothetical protein
MLTMAKRRSAIALVFVLAISAAACGGVTINKVLADPGKYRNNEITVPGTVTETVSVLGKGAYRISDGDQSLWVITSSGAPRKGARVAVTGHVQEGFDLGSLGGVIKLPESVKSGVVLMESSHKARD